LENLLDVKSAYEEKIKLDINQEFAKRVAKNLYNYLDSFNQVYLNLKFRIKILVKSF
jgi:hypothetical protein